MKTKTVAMLALLVMPIACEKDVKVAATRTADTVLVAPVAVATPRLDTVHAIDSMLDTTVESQWPRLRYDRLVQRALTAGRPVRIALLGYDPEDDDPDYTGEETYEELEQRFDAKAAAALKKLTPILGKATKRNNPEQPCVDEAYREYIWVKDGRTICLTYTSMDENIHYLFLVGKDREKGDDQGARP